MREFKHLSWHKRLELYRYLYIDKLSKKEIALRLQIHISTVYREIKKGDCEIVNSQLKPINTYSPEMAQEKYEKNRKNCGRSNKISKKSYILDIYENIIIKNDYSPKACTKYIELNKKMYPTIIIISYSTIYRYIYKKYFSKLTMKYLAYYRNRAKYKHINRQKRASIGTSIEYRDISILNRKEFGHWEMDSIEGSITSKKAVINLIERKTRKCYLFIINSKNCDNVVSCINSLQEKFKEQFNKVFKTITVDNGPEFSDYASLEKSIYDDSKRTQFYYCHSHSPHERGTNENVNRMLRRKIKKGSNFDNMSLKELENISIWINTYPREILNGKSSEYLFQKEINKILN